MSDPEPDCHSTSRPVRWYHFCLRTALVLAGVCVAAVGVRELLMGMVRSAEVGAGIPSQIRVADNSKLPPKLRALADLHRPLWLCPQCLAKLCYATGADPEKRFKALIAFARAQGMKAEADF